MKFLFNNSDQHVGGHGAPDLCLDRVLARAQKTLDTQMLLDPFEEQFHLLATLVQRGDGQGRKGRIVGQEDPRLARLGVFVSNPTQLLGVTLRHVKAVQRDSLIANDSCCSVGIRRVHTMSVHAAFRASHKKTPA